MNGGYDDDDDEIDGSGCDGCGECNGGGRGSGGSILKEYMKVLDKKGRRQSDWRSLEQFECGGGEGRWGMAVVIVGFSFGGSDEKGKQILYGGKIGASHGEKAWSRYTLTEGKMVVSTYRQCQSGRARS